MTSRWPDAEGAALVARVRAVVHAFAHDPSAAVVAAVFDALACELFAWQGARNPALARVADAFLGGRDARTADEIPAVPTDVFKVARVACFPPEAAVRVFRTSGTTGEVRGEHAFADLALYAEVACAAAARWLLPAPRYRCVLLCLDEAAAHDSSLTFMLARFAERWSPGIERPFYVAADGLEAARALRDLGAAQHGTEPVALLGTTYGFVHLLDTMGTRALALPPGSVAMPTGGYKGRSRELDPAEFVALLASRFGLGRAQIVGEYGMTELASQGYEAVREGAPPGRYRAPPWVRVTAVDPTSLRPVEQGTAGLLRVLDLANVGSAVAVQTSDLGRIHPDGFEVLGRAPGAVPRGCARALDALLSGG